MSRAGSQRGAADGKGASGALPAPPSDTLRDGRFELRFARGAAELDAALRLRYRVFNLELGEGLAGSEATGRDEDEFDAVCHHLLVSDGVSGEVVGCYRLQTTAMARANRGFYSSSLFDLSAVPAGELERAAEIGRACVARSYRNSVVLFLLWKGLALYVERYGLDHLFGCCSLTSQRPADGSAALRYLEERGHLHPRWAVEPRPATACPLPPVERAVERLPALFHTYLRYGAKACGRPAIDRAFKTIDFLVALDVHRLGRHTRKTFFG